LFPVLLLLKMSYFIIMKILNCQIDNLIEIINMSRTKYAGFHGAWEKTNDKYYLLEFPIRLVMKGQRIQVLQEGSLACG